MEKEAINAAITKATGIRGNFCDDLNACHEMEKYLDALNIPDTDYLRQLCDVCRPSGEEPDSIDDLLTAIRATARQRCEAFLKTLNLWTEVNAERKADK